ncbi:MAG: hypothetical protein AAGH38_09960 [Pseudomonadota bacterium]
MALLVAACSGEQTTASSAAEQQSESAGASETSTASSNAGGSGFEAGSMRDLNGVWQAMSRANFDVETHHARSALQLTDGPMGPVPDKSVVALGAVGAVPAGYGVVEGGSIPYTEDALKTRDENKANWVSRDPEIKCYLPGVPRATYLPFPFQILQNDGQTLFVYEFANTVRNIFLDDPGEAPIDSWMGQSYGYWDGDSFVVEVTAQNGRTWIERAGNFTSPETKVTERFTKVDDNHIRYQATLEDPSIYTEPWTMEMTLYRLTGADAELQEFNCVPFVEELLYGNLRKEPVQ